jgi:hypothetical protein
MSGRESFDDALDAAIDAIRRGEHIDDVLARYPHHAGALRPLLQSAPFGTPGRGLARAPMSPRLADNFTIVQAAVQRARTAESPLSRSTEQPHVPWQRRRLSYASLSLPAGVIALIAFAGISGAAAASVAVTNSDIPSRVAGFVAHPLAGVSSGDDHGGGSAVTPAGIPKNTPDAGSTPGGESVVPTAPGSPAQGTARMTVSGTISNVHGNVFTLTTADGDYKVNIDSATAVSGAIADGVTATVTGAVTGQKNLHAERVSVSDAAGTPAAAPARADSPTASPANDPTPGEPTPSPSNDHTPGPPADHTPGPPAGHTPGPPADHTPPGQGGANGNGRDNGKKP